MPLIVGVTFDTSSRIYSYFSDDLSIQIGDRAVVESPHDGYTLVRVVSVGDTIEGLEKAYKYLVCKIDDSAYLARKAKDREIALLRIKLEKEKKLAEERKVLESLREVSPEAAEIVDKLEKLL